MRALHARVGSPGNTLARSRPRPLARAFQTSLDGGPEREHDGPLVVPIRSNDGELRLEERAGRVYARVSMGGSSPDDGDDLAFPPPPTGVFYAGSELRPGCYYLLSPGGAVLTMSSSSSLTVAYEVKDDGGKGGIGALGEMLARSMVAGASEEVKAKLEDVF